MFGNRRWVIWLVVALVFAVFLANYLYRVPKRHYCDFRVYHHTAIKVLRGENIYFRDTMAVTPFKYSPFFAFCFVPLGLLPIKIAAGVFFGINFILTILMFRLAAAVVIPWTALQVLRGPKLWLLYGLGGLFLSRFVFLTWESGQVSILMCVLVLAGLVCLSKGKDAAAGAFMAASMLIKYMPVIFLPYMLVQRKYRAVMWTMIFVVIWLAVPALMVGIQKEAAYLAYWIPSIIETSLDKGSLADPKNQSLISMVIRYCSDCGAGINAAHLTLQQGKILAYTLAALLYLLALVPPFGNPRDHRIDYALLFCYFPLFNPNGWELNFVAMGVGYFFLLGYLIRTHWKDFFVGACVVGAFAVSSLFAKDIVGRNLESLSELLSYVTIGALFLVMALIKIKFEKKGRI